MFVKLKAEKYEKLKSFFKGPEFIRASAVIYSNRDGDVFVDNEEEPNIAFVNTSNFSYLSGGLSSLKKSDDFKTFFNDLFEKDKSTKKHVIKIVTPDKEWIAPVMEIIKEKEPYIMPYRQYQCRKVKLNWREMLPNNYEVREIDNKFLEDVPLELAKDIEGLIEKTQWNSKEKFIAHYGGICLFDKDKLISHSFMFYNKGDDSYELSIATDKEYRLRGFGSITTAACAELALKRASIVRWTCKAQNEGSVKTALKAGFELVKENDTVFVNLR
jgi:RimJ/RimL family protein N-acetyltransferase